MAEAKKDYNNNTIQLINLAKRVQALAEIGQHYAHTDYDLDRYTELEKISIVMMSLMTDKEVEQIALGIEEKKGYRTPKADVRAVVFNDDDEILMVREEIDGNWSLPGGWADIGFTPAEIAVKETEEEAGMKVEAKRLLAVFDKKCHDHPPDVHYAYKIFIECKALNDKLETGYETSDAGFFSLKNLPELSKPRNTLKQVELMFAFRKKEISWPYIDLNE
ncbi:MAG: NUDIX hydrolase [Bacteroidales bacterium]|nr:NUDIX hydrolase [Bacteroidales bacterium]